jgi:hypothetical protein
LSRRLLVAAGVELFEETGEWPKIDWVQQALVTWRDETNARREARRLPSRLGGVKDGRLVLGVRAFYEAEPSSPLLEAFRIGLREAWRSYRSATPPTEALLSASDLVNRANVSAVEAEQAIELLSVEGLLERRTERVGRVVPTIRHYRAASTVEEYLEVKGRFERRRRRRRLSAGVARPLRGALRSEGWIRAVLVATLATLLAALALWIGEEVFDFPSSSGGSTRTPPSSQPRPSSEGTPASQPPPAPAGRR